MSQRTSWAAVAETPFDDWIASNYDRLWPELFEAPLLDDAVAFLAALADGGAALEFGVGTGRIAIPLTRRGIPVEGIELSEAMVRRLQREPGGSDIPVTIGDFAGTRLAATFRLVYLVRNTITNLTTLDEQVEAFRNAAAHLDAGGYFVVENYVPVLRRLPPGQIRHLFTFTPTHIGVEEYSDLAAQVAISHHWWELDGRLRRMSSPHRFAWPAELDLMARLAGLTLIQRWANWDRSSFTDESPSHVSVWRK